MAWESLGNFAQQGFMLMNPIITGGAMPYVYANTTCAVYGSSGVGAWGWTRHTGGANYLYCDQHVKWVRTPQDWKVGGVWAAVDAQGNAQSYWYDGYCPYWFTPAAQ